MMPINTNQLRTYIINPALEGVGLYSAAASRLLLGTCAQESAMGTYLHQMNGPALGIYQMEPNTHDDIWHNYIDYRTELSDEIQDLVGVIPHPDLMIHNLKYATIMARLHYYRVAEPLPDKDDVEGLAKYWKKYYNTEMGRGTTREFITNYERYVL